jgi:sialate O-acetylesterase
MMTAFLVGISVGPVTPAAAAVKPHGLFTEGMVLQQGTKVPVWGAAVVGEKVTVRIQGQEVTAAADQSGKWIVWLKPLKAGGPFELSIQGSNTIQLRDVFVGEVWVCSGQSNMEWPLSRTRDAKKAIAASANPNIRLFKAPKTPMQTPQTELSTAKGAPVWTACDPKTVESFSAVGYYFGRDLQKARGVPVGLIQSAWGGTAAERWTSRAAMDANPELSNLKGNDLYNGMIAPLMPYAIKGVIWYQGESNAGRAKQYFTLFSTMIQQWRQDWKQGDFSFLFVQLAPYDQVKQADSWAELREAQLFTALRVPHTAQVVITDYGDAKDIHPQDKEPVGARLALAARAMTYGEKIVWSGPVYSGMKTDGNKAVLTFDHTGSGLEAKGGPLKGFTLAGADMKFVEAEAVIKGNTVVVSSSSVDRPVAVRYGWANNPVVNLFNREGLPATPFRTDVPPEYQPKSGK